MSEISVLIADDQPIVRRGVALLLEEEAGITVLGEAADGWETFEAVKRLRPDVVLMDVDMPGSGLDATRRITESVPAVSVLILTVHDREDFLFQALQTDALGYILKTATISELTDAIRTVHAKDVFIYPRMATKLVGNYLKRVGTNGRQDGYDKLSTREREVLPLLAESHTNQGDRGRTAPEPVYGTDLSPADNEEARHPQPQRAAEIRPAQRPGQPGLRGYGRAP